MKPQGAEVFLDGLHYKLGVHKKWFYHNGVEWILSSRLPYEIEDAIIRAQHEVEKVKQHKAEVEARQKPGKRLTKDLVLDYMVEAGRPVTMAELVEKTKICRATVYYVLRKMTGAEIRRASVLARGATKRKTTAWEIAA